MFIISIKKLHKTTVPCGFFCQVNRFPVKFIGDIKSLFSVIIFDQNVVQCSNLVCNFTIIHSFTKFIKITYCPKKLCQRKHFFAKISKTYEKNDRLLRAKLWFHKSNKQEYILVCLKAKYAQFSAIFNVLMRSFEISSSTCNHIWKA